MNYIWKIRCPESGYIVGECGCQYCFNEFEMDDGLDPWSEEETWEEFEFDMEDYTEEEE